MEILDDKNLIEEYLDGNEQSLEILIGKYLKIIYSFVYNNVGDQAVAEDITQEVFIKVWKKLGKYKMGQNFKVWLFVAFIWCTDILDPKLRGHKLSILSGCK